MFNSDKKKKALQKLETAQNKCKRVVEETAKAVEELYDTRKIAVKKIEEKENRIKRLPGIDVEIIKLISDARASISLFIESVNNENKKSSINDSYSKQTWTAAAGASAGAAIAAFGPSVAMAMATTFGTAATGTAISSLAGAAATNAALAWLGGGALAVGGGGIAAGSAILSMLGPIGWAVGGISIGIAGFTASKKNLKIAEEAEKMSKEIDMSIDRMKRTQENIKKLTCEITANCEKLDFLTNNSSANYNLIAITIIQLCSQINRRFSL